MRLRWWVAAAVLFACGRTPVYKGAKVSLPPTGCTIGVDLEQLDFGTVKPGQPYDLEVRVENDGVSDCHLRSLTLARDGDEGFSRPLPAPTELTLAPNEQLPLLVRFSTAQSVPPFDRAGRLTFDSDDLAQPHLSIALEAHLPHCSLQVPQLVDVGLVAPFATKSANTALTNTGDLACVLTGFALSGDDGFAVHGEPQTPAELAPGAQLQLIVEYSSGPVTPLERKAQLAVTEQSSAHPQVINLTATLQMCLISASPSPFDFGNVMLNTTATHSLTLSNGGTDECTLTGFSLDPITDPGFSLPSPPLEPLLIPPQGSAAVPIAFAAADSAPPHLRNGSLSFRSDDPTHPGVTVPLSAFINTVCTQAGQYIYTIDTSSNTLSRFDPATLTSTPVGNVNCPTSKSPFSMNIDQSGTAWILYWDFATSGEIFKVDVNTADCQPTGYVSGQHGMDLFGMGSSFDPNSGVDTLYIAGGTGSLPTMNNQLATLDLSSLTVSLVGPTSLPGPELAGTGDGQLWGFSPAAATGAAPLLDRLDKTTGATLDRYDLTGLSTSPTGYAIKFWGGAFYIFLGSEVWKVERADLLPGKGVPAHPPVKVLDSPGLDVVGAGVSTCAPLLPP